MKKQVSLSIAPDHPAFAGHFPGRPIVPGVLLLDEAMYAIAADLGHAGGWQIGSVKFISPLGPGASVVVEHEAQPNGAIRFDIRDGERHIVSGSLTPIAAA